MPFILSKDSLDSYVEQFNSSDHESYRQQIPNAEAGRWLASHIPLLDCPDSDIETTYYFRWWTFRKHLKQTPDGFVVTEFLPEVNWSGSYNTINAAAPHHFREGRWLRGSTVLRDYARHWLRGSGDVRSYSFCIADSILAYVLATGDRQLAIDLLPELVANDQAWDDHRDPNGLYWQIDDRDAMEDSISGKHAKGQGYRVTINSYMYGDALAIAQIAQWAGDATLAERYRAKATQIKRLTETTLWDEEAAFFKVLPREVGATLTDVRELHGYTPWYFDLPEIDKAVAWSQLTDPQGFYAPFGPTTAEQRHPKFMISYQGHECQWNGPSWPFSTAITLTGLANLLNGKPQNVITRNDYLETLNCYTKSHNLKLDDGREVKWIDENLNPFTGQWLARAFLKTWRDGEADPTQKHERGKDYNHSTYCDLIIHGLIGVRPQTNGSIVINPLTPDSWDYFCLDGIPAHGRIMTVIFDRTGSRYGRGTGFRVYENDHEIAASDGVMRMTIQP